MTPRTNRSLAETPSDELAAFFQATYAEARVLPPTFDAFRSDAPYAADSAWFTVEVDGVMTSARRRLFVPISALRSALTNYGSNGERLIYPDGTALIGEHWLEGERVETTAMLKRPDGFWDFGPGKQRRWNEVQNTSKDIQLLSNYLLVQYKSRVWNS